MLFVKNLVRSFIYFLVSFRWSLNDADDFLEGHIAGMMDGYKLRYYDEQLTLTYSGGQPCTSGFPRSTIINLICNQTQGTNQPIILLVNRGFVTFKVQEVLFLLTNFIVLTTLIGKLNLLARKRVIYVRWQIHKDFSLICLFWHVQQVDN